MINKRKKKSTSLTGKVRFIKNIVIIIAVALIVSMVYLKFFKADAKTYIVPNSTDKTLKIASEDTIVDKIHNVNKLVPLEIDLNENIVIDNSWGNLDIFKKIQKVHFYGTGNYSVDLSNISKDNIDINKVTGTVTITIPKPVVDSISIDRDKTTYEGTDNGLFRFGDIKMSADEYNVIEKEVKTKMTEKLKDDEHYNKAVDNAKKNLANILKTVSEGTIKVEVEK